MPTDRYLEDYVEGTVTELGTYTLSVQEIIDFGLRFDPQPFHTDPEAAATGPYGGLIASGWHTCAAAMPLIVSGYLSPASSLGSPGMESLRWLRPVRPDQAMSVRTTVQQVRRSASKPDRGLVTGLLEVCGPDGVVALSAVIVNVIAARPD